MHKVLEVKNLTKRFGNFTAVDSISFSIKLGEVVGLLGPNGAGKTTTIQMLLGIMDPTYGQIQYFGKDFTKYRVEILKVLNFASTYISLPWYFKVYEILDIFAQLYEVPNRKNRIKKLLAEFELEDLQNRSYNNLSAGEKTRLILTKAFLNYPKLLLLDEPTASLDLEIALKVREFLKKQKYEYNVSMLLTSHNMAEVAQLCDRILILDHGRVIDEGTPENLAKNITECEVELMIIEDRERAIAFFDGKEIPYEVERFLFTLPMDEKRIAEFLMLLADEKIKYQEISIKKADLEDYFLQALQKDKND